MRTGRAIVGGDAQARHLIPPDDSPEAPGRNAAARRVAGSQINRPSAKRAGRNHHQKEPPMKQNACFLDLSPFEVEAFEGIEERAAALGRALEIEIRDRWERRPRKDRALYIHLTNSAAPDRAIFASIPCRRSELGSLGAALYLLADTLAAGEAKRARPRQLDKPNMLG